MSRYHTFAVLVTVVDTFLLSKLVDMDAICIGGEGSRVWSVCGTQTVEIFLSRQKNSERAQCVYKMINVMQYELC